MTNNEKNQKQIECLDQAYAMAWSRLQDYARGSKKHKQIMSEFMKLSAQLIALKNQITKE